MIQILFIFNKPKSKTIKELWRLSKATRANDIVQIYAHL